MAVSAFKSNSRRGNLTTSTAPPQPATAANASKQTPSAKKVDSGESSRKPKVPPRRSRSVSAFLRARPDVDLNLDFTNKRDNPLFWAADSPPSDGNSAAKTTKSDQVGSRAKSTRSNSNGFSGSGGERRGRTASRDLVSGQGKSAPIVGAAGSRGVGRSLSRVDTGRRRRSVSRSHNGSNYEEQKCTPAREKRKTNVNGKERDPEAEDKPLITRSNSDLAELLECWQNFSPEIDDFTVSQSSLSIPPWDGGSVSSFSDAEERGYRSYSELTNFRRFSGDSAGRGAIRAAENEGIRGDFDIQDNYENVVGRSNSAGMPVVIVGSPPESVNSGETDSIVGIGEFARKLEESEERARKLRAELAIEEHRGEELSNILNEIIPYERSPDVKKPRALRKASMERRVSRRLEEEALAFFDECVSISTFDDSELSSFEDPVVAAGTCISDLANSGSRVSGTPVVAKNSSSLVEEEEGSSRLGNYSFSPCTAESMSSKPQSAVTNSYKRELSFSKERKNGGSSSLEHEIKLYVKAFAKGSGSCSSINSGGGKERSGGRAALFGEDEFPSEKMLIERMSLRNRIEDGGLFFCECSSEFGFPFLT